MASPLYDNAWLKSRQPGKDTTTDITDARKRRASSILDNPFNETGGVDPVQATKQFLAKPSVTQSPLSPQDEAELQSRLAWNKQNNAIGTDIASRQLKEKHGAFRGLTENLAKAGHGFEAASLPLMLAGPEASGLALAGGTAMGVPDQLRRAYMPQDDETRPGVGEAAMTGLGLLLPGGGIGKALSEGKAAEEGVMGARLRKTFGVRQAEAAPSYTAPFQESGVGGQMPSLARPNLHMGGPMEEAGTMSRMRNPSGSTTGGMELPGAMPRTNIDRTRTFGDLNERVTNHGLLGRETQRPAFKALEELGSRGSQDYMTTQAAKNAPGTEAILGPQATADPMATIMKRLEESLYGTNQPVELSGELNSLSPLDRASRATKQARSASFRTNSPLSERF